jgi:hypothetical protein
MYVFKDFNRTNAHHIRSSLFLYFAMLSVVWSATSFLLEDSVRALTVTIVTLLAAHIVRILQLIQVHNPPLTPIQYVTAAAMAPVMTLFVIFAFSLVMIGESGLSWATFRSVFLSVSLAVYLSVYVDFAIASVFHRPNKRYNPKPPA